MAIMCNSWSHRELVSFQSFYDIISYSYSPNNNLWFVPYFSLLVGICVCLLSPLLSVLQKGVRTLLRLFFSFCCFITLSSPVMYLMLSYIFVCSQYLGIFIYQLQIQNSLLETFLCSSGVQVVAKFVISPI